MTRQEALKIAKPILFNTEMVKAILEGRKYVTRRLVKSRKLDVSMLRNPKLEMNPSELRVAADGTEYPYDLKGLYAEFEYVDCSDYFPLIRAPYQISDILYVRETWQKCKYKRPEKAIPTNFKEEEYVYLANHEICNSGGSKFKWKPSIHMPKEAARIFLRVTDVRVERLRDITITGLQEEGILNEGYISPYAAMTTTAFEDFKDLWNSTIKKADLDKYGWEANPWVYVIQFERAMKDEAM